MQGGEAKPHSIENWKFDFILLCVRCRYKNRWILGWGYRGLVCCIVVKYTMSGLGPSRPKEYLMNRVWTKRRSGPLASMVRCFGS
ncbi:hypothetical protein BJX62DRAFT_196546 [Aspergillus germanicus]